MTDESNVYTKIGLPFASHDTVAHGKREYVRGEAHINSAESFFSRLKRQLYGTHHAVSKRHLHRYVAEVAFKHNTRVRGWGAGRAGDPRDGRQAPPLQGASRKGSARELASAHFASHIGG
jgi:hypothetical protein